MANDDFQPDEEARSLARQLAERTVGDLRDLRQSRGRDSSGSTLQNRASELGMDVPLDDVMFVLEEFALQLDFAVEVAGRMPCIRIGDGDEREIVPFSLPVTWPFGRARYSSWRPYWPFPLDLMYRDYVRGLESGRGSERVTLETEEDILERLHSGLSEFLSYRVAAFRAWLGWGDHREAELLRKSRRDNAGPPAPSSWSSAGGLAVELRCDSENLSIDFSHSYFIHFLNFGAPSSPVRNTLLGGRYVFRGTGPTHPRGTRRSQIFRIPPDYIAITNRF
jgi:hypothetical protein